MDLLDSSKKPILSDLHPNETHLCLVNLGGNSQSGPLGHSTRWLAVSGLQNFHTMGEAFSYSSVTLLFLTDFTQGERDSERLLQHTNFSLAAFQDVPPTFIPLK